MNPHIISLMSEGYKLKIKNMDRQMWLMGNYILSSVSVAIEHCLAGRKAKSKYLEKPLMEQANNELSEKDLQKQRELFVAKLMTMKTNFELKHKKDEKTK